MSGGASNVGGHQRIEAEFLNGDTKLAKFAFVGLNHVGVCLADLFEFRLNLTDGVVLQVFDFLESGTNHAERLWVNARRSENLVDLCVLRFEGLLNGLQLSLENQVAQARLPMQLVNQLVELIEELGLLLFEVLVLLQLYFVLPLHVLVLGLLVLNFNLAFTELALD